MAAMIARTNPDKFRTTSFVRRNAARADKSGQNPPYGVGGLSCPAVLSGRLGTMKRRANRIDLIGIAPIGFSIAINRQCSTVVSHEAYRRKGGTEATLTAWQAECATCGEGFTQKTASGRLPERRRCKAHHQPGRPVRQEVQP